MGLASWSRCGLVFCDSLCGLAGECLLLLDCLLVLLTHELLLIKMPASIFATMKDKLADHRGDACSIRLKNVVEGLTEDQVVDFLDNDDTKKFFEDAGLDAPADACDFDLAIDEMSDEALKPLLALIEG